MSAWDKKIVWPKDGHRGRGRRGFFDKLNDIVRGKGPDIFIQDRRVSNRPIDADLWGNWDSYHSRTAYLDELSNKTRLGFKSRDMGRYDPVTRTYKRWAQPFNAAWGPDPEGWDLPRLTEEELLELDSQRRRGTLPLRSNGAVDWANDKLPTWRQNGPERFERNYNWYWRRAHRLAGNQTMSDRQVYNCPQFWYNRRY